MGAPDEASSAPDLGRIAFVTGADAAVFGNLAILMESFAAFGPTRRLWVCDFGLSAAQRAFLDERGALLPSPAVVAASGRTHPWYLKTALRAYLGARDVEAVVWLDADMMLLSPIEDRVAHLCAVMRARGASVACCPDTCGLDLGGFIAEWQAHGRDVTPFARLLDAAGVERRHPYLNTGFVIFGEVAFLDRWQALTFAMEPHLCFDQSTFNTLAYADNRSHALALDAREWNIHGELLGALRLDGVHPPARVLHATSDGTHHERRTLDLRVGEQAMRAELKLPRREDLRALMLGRLDAFMLRHAEALARHGLLA